MNSILMVKTKTFNKESDIRLRTVTEIKSRLCHVVTLIVFATCRPITRKTFLILVIDPPPQVSGPMTCSGVPRAFTPLAFVR